MTPAYLTPTPEAEGTRAALAALVPTLTTEGLTLRAPMLSDWETLSPIWRTDRAQYFGGPFNEEDAWLDFAQLVASWIFRGVGWWTVTLTETGKPLGVVGIAAEVGDPEPEMGWLFTQEAEGHGYASEAARAVHGYAFETMGLKTLVSFIDRKNDRSAALARRLGAVEDDSVLSPELAAEDYCFRHQPETRP